MDAWLKQVKGHLKERALSSALWDSMLEKHLKLYARPLLNQSLGSDCTLFSQAEKDAIASALSSTNCLAQLAGDAAAIVSAAPPALAANLGVPAGVTHTPQPVAIATPAPAGYVPTGCALEELEDVDFESAQPRPTAMLTDPDSVDELAMEDGSETDAEAVEADTALMRAKLASSRKRLQEVVSSHASKARSRS